MDVLELLRVAWGSIRVNKMRSFLTILGIMIGVACVITMMTVTAGAQYDIERQMREMGSNLMAVYAGSWRSRGGVSGAAGSNAVLTEDDAAAMKREIPEIAAAAPTMRGYAQVVVGNRNWNSSIYGIDNELLEVRNWGVTEGRLFEPSELSRGARVALIGTTTATELFGEGQILGQPIRVQNVQFTVVGLLASKGMAPGSTSFDQDSVLMIPLKTARTRLLGRQGVGGDAVDNVYVSVENEEDMTYVEEEIKKLLNTRHRIKPDRDAFSVSNMSEWIEQRLEQQNTFNSLLSIIAAVSLLVGGIGIMNIMLVSVTERTREIGLRMAVGARNTDIMQQFLVEAIALCIAGGILGIGLAVAVSTSASVAVGWPIYFQWWVLVMAVVFSGVIGIFFGFYPARSAANKDPIEALRTE
ncbi:MAG: FtsX-like permease family protein [Gammaproteobacteria bacterium]|nr:FtsX-like permease family protein [Gammaproteobacteria bacterium]